MEQPAPVSFRRDVIPAFSQAGCNMGACHGTPTGKGGFRLSLRGYLPDQDFTDPQPRGRRPADQPARRRHQPDPPQAAGRDPPRGRPAARRGTPRRYEFLRDWIAEGAKDDPAAPAAVRLEILPGSPRPERPGEDPAGRRPGPLADGTDPRRHADLLLRLVEPRDRRGRRRRPRRLQEPGRGRRHRPLPRPGRQRPADPPGRGPRLPGRRGPAGQRRSTGTVFAKLNRMRIAPSEPAPTPSSSAASTSTRSASCPRPRRSRRSWPTRRRRPPRQGGRPAARPPRVLRLLDPQVRRHPPLQRPPDPAQGDLRLQPLDPGAASSGTRRWTSSSASCSRPTARRYANPAANYYRISRDPENSVETTAQLFLGVRIQCAKCHNHPFERWTQDDYYGFAAFFSRVRPEEGQPARRRGDLLRRRRRGPPAAHRAGR